MRDFIKLTSLVIKLLTEENEKKINIKVIDYGKNTELLFVDDKGKEELIASIKSCLLVNTETMNEWVKLHSNLICDKLEGNCKKEDLKTSYKVFDYIVTLN